MNTAVSVLIVLAGASVIGLAIVGLAAVVADFARWFNRRSQ
jgi:hypothetical protein